MQSKQSNARQRSRRKQRRPRLVDMRLSRRWRHCISVCFCPFYCRWDCLATTAAALVALIALLPPSTFVQAAFPPQTSHHPQPPTRWLTGRGMPLLSSSPPRWHPSSHRMALLMLPRGGSSSEKEDHTTASSSTETLLPEEQLVDAASVLSMEQEVTSPAATGLDDDQRLSGDETPSSRRRTSDIILTLTDSPVAIPDEDKRSSLPTIRQDMRPDLRLLFMERRDAVIEEESRQGVENSSRRSPVAAVKSLLHKMAPKIPAIKLSPDVSLAVRALPGDGDPGLAASLVATLAHVWEVIVPQTAAADSATASGSGSSCSSMSPGSANPPNNVTGLVARELVQDRRFEQLMETIVCGVDVDKRIQEASELLHEREESCNNLILLMKDAVLSDGLSIRDACRAAWGVAMLGLYDVKHVGETNVKELFVALAMHTRELLLARIRLLCQEDFFVEKNATVSVENRISQIVSEIAEDTATALWVFGCVQAVTGVQCRALVHVCSLILCYDPILLRESVQEQMAALAEPIVGGNDVIDKLERAERFPDVDSDAHKRDEDVFLDFLSPTEVTDVLWALGIYAMKEYEIVKSISLLSDIAVDRVVEWLRHDLKHATRRSDNDDTGRIAKKGNCVTVGANERTSYHDDHQQPNDSGGKNMYVGDRMDAVSVREDDSTVDDVTSEFEYVQVVDAATILDSERENAKEKGVFYDSMTNESLETVDAATLIQTEELFEHGRHSQDESNSDPLETYLQDKESTDWIFSAHDLCSIAWAATELRDSIKSQITQMVADLLVIMGKEHLSKCSIADYVNLIWALAKESNEQPSRSLSNIHFVARWITESVYQSSGIADVVIDSDSWHLLRNLQPPELSRLLWSLASLSTTFVDDVLSRLAGVLSLAGLETASRYLHLFSTEDLARISWAFVECSDYEAVLETHPSAFQSLGRVLGLVDVSLTSWQSGCSYAPHGRHGKRQETFRDENRFTSFFGRARSHLFRVERKIEEMDIEEIEDYPLPSLLYEKVRLPFLRDFPVDPSTLCKLCGSLSKPGTMFSRVCDTRTMTTIIIRLMTSRNGRLLGECHVNDLAHLCAAAVSLTKPSNREIVGLFTRRTLKILNEHPSILSSATLPIFSILLSSLGDLGTKHHPEVDSSLAYRRLQLTAKLPLELDLDVMGLSNDSLIFLTRGLAKINATDVETEVVEKVLKEMNRRIGLLTNGNAQLEDLTSAVSHFYSPGPDRHQNFTETNETSSEGSSMMLEDSVRGKSIHQYATNMLNHIARATQDKVHSLAAKDLRKILSCFVALPFRVDSLVAATQDEVMRRNKVAAQRELASSKLQQALDHITPDIAKELGQIQKAEPSKAMKRLLRRFGKEKNRKEEDDEDQEKSFDSNTSLADLARVILTSVEVQEQEADFPTDDSDRVEYGRIQELIHQYHRIDFESGAHLSRFDKEGQRLMTKRMMSRLLP